MADQQLELIRELNRAYEQMSVLALSDLLYPDYIHVTRPNSLNIPDRNKTQYLEYFENMFSNWTSVGPTVYEILANAPGKIVVHIASDVTLKSGPTVTYESCTALEIADDPSGSKKIKREDEFIDANAHAQGFAPYLAAKA